MNTSTQNPSSTVLPAAMALVAAFAAVPAEAQVVRHESLTGWTHAHAAPYWTDDVPNADAQFGAVDQLNYVFWLRYNSPTITLQPGDYVASARLMKAVSGSGAAPLHLEVEVDGYPVRVTLPVADQTIDEFVDTPNLNFTVTQPNTQVTFRLENIGSSLKRDYLFDSFRLGEQIGGGAVVYESADDFTYANPHLIDHGVPEQESAFGRVANVPAMWWLALLDSVEMQPGSYFASFRLMKHTSTIGREPLTFDVTVGGQVVATTTIEAAAQTVDQYVFTQPVYFVLQQPESVEFKLHNTQGMLKANYKFDAVHVSMPPTFFSLGTGCAGSNGIAPTMSMLSPTSMAGPYRIQLSGARPMTLSNMMFGLSGQDIPLDLLGMPTCRLLVQPALTTQGLTNAAGEMEWEINIPHNRELLGMALFNQALIIDPGANALGVVVSEGVGATIGN